MYIHTHNQNTALQVEVLLGLQSYAPTWLQLSLGVESFGPSQNVSRRRRTRRPRKEKKKRRTGFLKSHWGLRRTQSHKNQLPSTFLELRLCELEPLKLTIACQFRYHFVMYMDGASSFTSKKLVLEKVFELIATHTCTETRPHSVFITWFLFRWILHPVGILAGRDKGEGFEGDFGRDSCILE